MKSSLEYLEQYLQKNEFGDFIYTQHGLLSAIRQAQKDAITLCAEKMDMIYWDGHNKVGTRTAHCMVGVDNVQPNRNGLIELIKELK